MRDFPVAPTVEQLQEGIMWNCDLGKVKLHAHETDDVFDSYTY